jgi:hypothetical protein
MNGAIAITFLCLSSLLPLTAGAEEHSCKSCGQKTYGTSIEWVDTPSDAANQAKKEEKLVFVLHVSGHFEDPGVT